VNSRYGTTTADRYALRIVGSLPAKRAGKLWFPPYSKTVSTYEKVRSDMAAQLSR
jgi:hypothetical protein